MLEFRVLPARSQSISSSNRCLLGPYSVPGSVPHTGAQRGARQTRAGCRGARAVDEGGWPERRKPTNRVLETLKIAVVELKGCPGGQSTPGRGGRRGNEPEGDRVPESREATWLGLREDGGGKRGIRGIRGSQEGWPGSWEGESSGVLVGNWLHAHIRLMGAMGDKKLAGCHLRPSGAD